MSEQAHHHPNYVAVWIWLLLLATFSVVLSFPPLSQPITLLLIFEAAVVKAVLVAMYFMHLKFERLLIYSLVIVPLVFFGILMLVILPDIALYEAATIHH
jgi:cytochrome c oxidase subunit 4